MGDSLSIVFTIILAVLIMFLFPMMDTFERQDDLSYMAVYTATVDFVDAVRNTGTLTMDMYNSFLTQIQSTGNLFDVTLEHREYKVVPAGNGNSEVVYLYHYTTEIENTLNSKDEKDDDGNVIKKGGLYTFNKGDYFYVSIKNRNKTQATLMEEAIYATQIDSFKIGVPYGGQIKSSYR